MNKKFLALVLTITLIPTAAIAATPKPTQAQIDAAKKIEAEKKAAADAFTGSPSFSFNWKAHNWKISGQCICNGWWLY